MTHLKNKNIWITGASSGIGESLAYECAKKGANLILSSRKKPLLEKVAEKCKSLGVKTWIFPLDLSDTSNIDILTKEIIQTTSTIDILINNGGISQRSLTKETPIEVDRKIMEVNFFGWVALTKSVLPHFIEKKSGHIVAVSSVAGKFGFHQRSAYSASKHAVAGFFEAMGLELKKDGISVTTVFPGAINTNISKNALNSEGQSSGKMDDLQEGGMSPEKCAKIIIRAIEKNKREVMMGGKELLLVYFKRYFPYLFYFVADRVGANKK